MTSKSRTAPLKQNNLKSALPGRANYGRTQEEVMTLLQTLNKPVNGYWDGGAKQRFQWRIDGTPQKDKNGQYIRIGSWEANLWFHVAVGKTERLTLSYAKKHLQAITGVPCSFEYIDA